jgi:YcxB-like protein
MEVDFTVTLGDLVRYNLYHAWHRPLYWSIIAVGAGVIAIMSPRDAPLIAHVIVFVFSAIVLTVVNFGSTAIIALLSYAPSKNRGTLGDHHLLLAPAGITESTKVSTSTWTWAGIPKVAQDRAYIFLYVQQNLAHVIPKRAFKSAAESKEFYDTAVRYWKSASTGPGAD